MESLYYVSVFQPGNKPGLAVAHSDGAGRRPIVSKFLEESGPPVKLGRVRSQTYMSDTLDIADLASFIPRLCSLIFTVGEYIWRTDRTGLRESRHAALGFVRSGALGAAVCSGSWAEGNSPWETERPGLHRWAAGSMLVSSLLNIDRWVIFKIRKPLPSSSRDPHIR